ncbi:hypothetical protein Kfla_1864 [Kribbella flavida DSM 17836]|uniref:PknH-like extracellular domain-containing protein n=1 Tax=Kribbella flavida (strain DSM 17836 / JCM 10339 / NBRC 14399) TaxID=479435 RepID=D2PPJ6_KRIFD|nr:hypothetical protein [Kribbella flavida]ADB30958.1 hypothetical protein Kfla_1864 [Kribbella flavida DSM 17836]
MRSVLAAAAAVAGAGLLIGCSPASGDNTAASPPPTTPIPVTVGGTVPVPTVTLNTAKPTDAAQPPTDAEQATAPPPATAGPVSGENLPTADKLGGWKTYVDPGGAEEGFLGNKTWTRQRSAHQAAYEALPVGCAGQLPKDPLPVPRHALQASYRTGADKPATALLLRFADAAKATAYFSGYQSRMAACGNPPDAQLAVQQLWSEPTAAASVRRYAGAESFVETSVVQGATVALLAADSDPSAGADWARSVVPALKAVIDSA